MSQPVHAELGAVGCMNEAGGKPLAGRLATPKLAVQYQRVRLDRGDGTVAAMIAPVTRWRCFALHQVHGHQDIGNELPGARGRAPPAGVERDPEPGRRPRLPERRPRAHLGGDPDLVDPDVVHQTTPRGLLRPALEPERALRSRKPGASRVSPDDELLYVALGERLSFASRGGSCLSATSRIA
jgi:hypothetical protein